ncbi:type II secretion system GspH family protein [Colwellia sp. D2M02]|uniref:Prepilin-type N-terminal cleavage/methylation domain-containing protein n=1 Tax=Colwellia asteriadis TaxID=517723 RepID=A0ABN1L3L3_9GAMM|nr:type II secretion system protein [Colwellia sp. D2M02]MBU2891763.1 type II secretion system GspH family protein [Colwellia sp. D2M02]
MKKQQGFTLIELVVVIVILGILAVTAAPKFINLNADAHEATLKAIKASMQSASTLVHSKSLIAGDQDAPFSDGKEVSVDSTNDVAISYGYPTNDSTDWGNMLDIDTTNDFTVAQIGTEGDGATAIYAVYANGKEPASPAAGDACSVQYIEATAVGAKPTITVFTGC